MHNPLSLATFTTLLVVAGANAQNYVSPTGTSPAAGTCNVIPFGSTPATVATWGNQIYQQMVTAAELSNTSGNICEIAFAPCADGIRHFDTIEVVLAMTTATTLSTTFASNLTTLPMTVLKATNYEWHNTINVWNRIGLDMPYPYLGTGNLVIQVTVTGAQFTIAPGTTGSAGMHRDVQQRVYSVGWSGTPPASGSSGAAAAKVEVSFGMADLHEFGLGCLGSNNMTPTLKLSGSAQLGSTTLAMSLSNALPYAPLFHVLAVTRNEPGVDMTILGAPTCTLYVPVQFLLGGLADSTGAYTLNIPLVPISKNLICTRVYTQFFPRDTAVPGNTFGTTASNYGRILVGN